MAALALPPPRTPSPKIRMHRSQSFDSPSSRISVTPIDDSPYSKSASAISSHPLPAYDALKAAEQALILKSNPSGAIMPMPRARAVVLHKRMSDDSMLSDESGSVMSDVESEYSSTSSSADAGTGGGDHPPMDRSASRSRSRFGLFTSSSPSPPIRPMPTTSDVDPQDLSFQQYQDPTTPMHDPWLVRVVLDLYDVRGFDWTMIAEPIERIWGFKTCSAEVLGILSGNGRVGRVWWD